MYKKLYLLASLSSLLLLSGCLETLNKTEPETAPTNIEAETSTPVQAAAEIIPQAPQAPQNPSLAAQATVINVASNEQFNEITSKGNVVVDFYATWCGPCKSVSPIIDKLAQQYAGKVLFVKVNVDKFSDLSTKFNVKGMPTFFFLKDGQKVDSFSGARDKKTFEQKIKSHFNI